MPTLADLMTFVDGLKRRAGNTLGELATNPTGLLSRNVSALSESLPERKQSVMPGVDGGGLLSRPSFEEWGANVAANNTPVSGLLGHTVYHGSPHKFDKFDASKIGTGEGAQAYGHGLYLAENPAVAKEYARMVRPETISVQRENGKWDALVLGPNTKPHAEKTGFATEADANKWAESVASQWGKGNVYKADLPDEWLPKMLDWDKPLSQQPEAVRKALEKLTPEERAAMNRQTAKMLNSGQGDGNTVYNAFGGYKDAPGAARKLRDLGVPGIRYKDGGSRGTDGGTHNYVVFPGMEHLLKILSRE